MKESSEPNLVYPSSGNARIRGAGVARELDDEEKQKVKAPKYENEVVDDIVEQAKKVQRVAEKIYFLSVLKRFGLAFGGILLMLGAISATAFFLLFFDIFSTGFSKNVELVVKIGLAMISVIHILAGLALLAG